MWKYICLFFMVSSANIVCDQFTLYDAVNGWETYVNIFERAYLDFQTGHAFYCIPRLVNDKKALCIGYGPYSYNLQKNQIEVENKTYYEYFNCYPTKSKYVELDSANFTENIFMVKVIGEDHKPISNLEIMHKGRLIKNETNDTFHVFTIVYSAESRLAGNKIIIHTKPLKYKEKSKINEVATSYDYFEYEPIVIDISSKKKGNYEVYLHKSPILVANSNVSIIVNKLSKNKVNKTSNVRFSDSDLAIEMTIR